MSASNAGPPDHRTQRSWPLTKLGQLIRVARESHETPIVGEPRQPISVSATETGITFIGHSSFLLQMGGKNILVDPVFSKRLVVLRRQRHPGLNIADLPPIDLVLITHAHMDHLNLTSLRKIVSRTRKLRGTPPEVIVPTGVDDLVQNIRFGKIHTMSWWDQHVVAGLRITMTPCRHWGARMFKDTHREFGGYTIQPEQGGVTVYHSGDTAYFKGFSEIGERLHPDVALLPIGAYFPDSYRSVHTSPEEAVRAFTETGAELMVPMHYGTFRLGREPMDEPLERLATEAVRLHLEPQVRVIAEGETLLLGSN